MERKGKNKIHCQYIVMNILKYINIPVFILSLAFGIFAVYVTIPDNRKILVYPTHENAQILQYRDKTGTCFSVKETEVKCPENSNDISKVPAQS
jgi:hypothetical protein